MRRSLALLALAGCSALVPADWHPLPRIDKPIEDIIRAARQVVEKEGYPVELEELPEDGGILLRTAWKEQLSPYRNQGKRRRVEIFAIAAETGGGVDVKVRVPLEFNESRKNTTLTGGASWISEGGDDDVATRVKEMLRMSLVRPKLDD